MQYGTRGAAAPERDDDPAARRVWALPVPMSRQKAPSLIATALLAGLATAGVIRTAHQTARQEHAAATSLARRSVESFAISISNEYGGQPASSAAYPWLAQADTSLVEPWRTTTLSASAPASAASRGGAPYAYRWTVAQLSNTNHSAAANGDGGASVRALAGREVDHVFASLGRYRLTLVVSEPDGAGGATEVATLGRALVCKYVRREIRSLSKADRDAYLDAFEVMMRVNASEGVARYGRHFRTIDEFAKMHLNLAADRECDRMHDGMGFLTNHAALTSAFEHGLQLVDPKLSVPYWDYTWDEREFRKRHGAFGEGRDAEFWRMDDMWSDEWFGSAENEHRTVVAGRFAWQTVTSGAAGGWANSVHNSYGYLRAPWNANKYPYVTRGHELCGTSAFNFAGFPSCALHHNLTFGTLGASWYDWVWHASYDPHGPVHVAIGGTFNCRAQYDSLNETVIPKDLERLRVFSYVTLKSGWRAHLVEMPKYCSMDTPQEECTPHCPDLDIVEKYKNISKLEEMWAVLLQGTRMYRGYTHEQKVKVLKTICQTPITPGDQLEASSPLDVSFWPIHPTMERLWAYKKLAHAFTDQTWGTTDGPSRYCTNNGCMGHHEDDVIPFDVVTEDDEGEYASRQLSNIELYKSLNPHSTRMPYVYDHFQWQHCDDSGYRFSQDFAAVDS